MHNTSAKSEKDHNNASINNTVILHFLCIKLPKSIHAKHWLLAVFEDSKVNLIKLYIGGIRNVM